jgi:NB-ARC domain
MGRDRRRFQRWRGELLETEALWSSKPQTLHAGPNDLSCVRTLKETVLSSSRSKFTAVGLRGSGGVGKTTACTIIANDVDVSCRFPDALLWIQLGDNTSAATVVDQIARVVDATGGPSFARQIRRHGEKSLDEVKEKAREWFEGKSILLIVDNVFKCSKDVVLGGNWISLLQDIPSAQSCILFSTRDHTITALSDEFVNFEPLKSPDDQRKMFLTHLRITSSDPKFDAETCDNVLQFCGGVPLALAAAAAYVRGKYFNWHSVVHDLRTSLHNENEDTRPVLGGHPGLASIFRVVHAKLDGDPAFVERQAGNVVNGQLCYSWAEAYCSLAVLD